MRLWLFCSLNNSGNLKVIAAANTSNLRLFKKHSNALATSDASGTNRQVRGPAFFMKIVRQMS